MSTLPLISQPVHRCSALLDHLARRTRVLSESALQPLGLRPRHLLALTILRDHADPTQQSLATYLQIDRTNLVGLLNDLERDGLIERRRSEEDRRRHTVHLTERGADRLAEAEFALAAAEAEVLTGLDPEQREALYQLLQLAAGGLTTDCTAAACVVTAAEPGAAGGAPLGSDSC